ncbi:CsgG/HfaB family protein [Breznakiellaceae bacterium SP9]
MKKLGTAVLLILVGLLVSCATPPTYPDILNNEQAGILLQRVDSYKGVYVELSINNGEDIYLAPDETYLDPGKRYGCGLPNGTYTLSAKYWTFGNSGYFRGNTEPVTFTIDNDRVLFRVEVIIKIIDNTIVYNVVLSQESGSTIRAASTTNTTAIEGAVAAASQKILEKIPAISKIALMYITAQDQSIADYIIGELEYIWVNEGYFITDRSELNRLRQEQNFGMSGEVDDATAVSIGKFAGADVIVTGRVDGEGDLRRLRLRVLNAQTAQVVGVASEKF